MAKVLPFSTSKPKRTYREAVRLQVGGTIEIWPSEDMGGSWAVYHRSRSGDSLGHIETFFGFAEAERAARAARAAAQHYGANFDEGANV